MFLCLKLSVLSTKTWVPSHLSKPKNKLVQRGNVASLTRCLDPAAPGHHPCHSTASSSSLASPSTTSPSRMRYCKREDSIFFRKHLESPKGVLPMSIPEVLLFSHSQGPGKLQRWHGDSPTEVALPWGNRPQRCPMPTCKGDVGCWGRGTALSLSAVGHWGKTITLWVPDGLVLMELGPCFGGALPYMRPLARPHRTAWRGRHHFIATAG